VPSAAQLSALTALEEETIDTATALAVDAVNII
jgi:hypothetical protein